MNNNVSFIYDIASLDQFRHQIVHSKIKDHAALSIVAKQFAGIFLSMLLKSVRNANFLFENPINSQQKQFYRQILDEQMSSKLSMSGSLGLADILLSQLIPNPIRNSNPDFQYNNNFEKLMRKVGSNNKIFEENNPLTIHQTHIGKSIEITC
ncbi:flagellar rod assembly protein/muramidase flgJ [Candidatus Photodesmus katoptron]|uniref:Flagellar rod assembly protein/muramidase FlgJ n=1 Tax=Candidatus Photodesmus katoptron Akat1 TaxID=1236703 RepID=S3DJR5_9GAMM|nr:rod-binding protein [Candidatus Photodesmus katoptron]EPE37960.1 flagellar rod assembly protein/muramidase FlgJ [Candidatus Photodesmus katoptron Akat1]KEY90282.1 flagellar rod assembly protein/muramidase flgJ [Candidatus Photodesmus katoptron]